MPMMVIAMMMAATHHPMAAHRPPNAIQSTLSSKSIGDIGDARGSEGAGTFPLPDHYIEADAQRQPRAGSGGYPGGKARLSRTAQVHWAGQSVMINCSSGSDLDPARAQSTVVGSVRA